MPLGLRLVLQKVSTSVIVSWELKAFCNRGVSKKLVRNQGQWCNLCMGGLNED